VCLEYWSGKKSVKAKVSGRWVSSSSAPNKRSTESTRRKNRDFFDSYEARWIWCKCWIPCWSFEVLSLIALLCLLCVFVEVGWQVEYLPHPHNWPFIHPLFVRFLTWTTVVGLVLFFISPIAFSRFQESFVIACVRVLEVTDRRCPKDVLYPLFLISIISTNILCGARHFAERT